MGRSETETKIEMTCCPDSRPSTDSRGPQRSGVALSPPSPPLLLVLVRRARRASAVRLGVWEAPGEAGGDGERLDRREAAEFV
jgi:hypothetical protein